jgi:hypothetical protein
MKRTAKLMEAVQSRSVSAITKAVADLADEIDFQLKPPYTELKEFKAREEGERFIIRFAAKLCLHYSGFGKRSEGFVLVVEFSGEAFAESPSPPLHELFYAEKAEMLSVYGYGGLWRGEAIATPVEFAKNLEVNSPALVQMNLQDFYRILDSCL